MNFKQDLWEGDEIVFNRLKQGGKTIDTLIEIFSKVLDLQQHYIEGLKKLLKNSSTSEELGSLSEGLTALQQNLDFISKQYEEAGKSVSKDSLLALQLFKEKHQKKRKQLQEDWKNLDKELDRQKTQLSKAQKNYYKSCKDVEKADIELEKVKNADQKSEKYFKISNAATLAHKEVEVNESTYRALVKEVVQFQTVYEEKVSTILAECQELEAERMEFVQSGLQTFSNSQELLLGNLSQNFTSLKTVIQTINRQNDLQAFIRANRTGKLPELNVEFIAYESKDRPRASSRFGNMFKNILGKSEKPPEPNPRSPMPAVQEYEPQPFSSDLNLPPPPPSALPTIPGLSKMTTVCAKALYEYVGRDNNELTFKVNDIIQSVTQETAEWCKGTINGKTGVFPANYVEYGNEDDLRRHRSLCKALFDFEATNEKQLAITTGEILIVISSDTATDGWYTCKRNNISGEVGLVPASYVEIVR